MTGMLSDEEAPAATVETVAEGPEELDNLAVVAKGVNTGCRGLEENAERELPPTPPPPLVLSTYRIRVCRRMIGEERGGDRG